jgi:hypothetical protein
MRKKPKARKPSKKPIKKPNGRKIVLDSTGDQQDGDMFERVQPPPPPK